MKNNFNFNSFGKLLLFALLILTPMLILAQGEETIDFGSATSVITWLMPFITLGVTWLVKKIAPFVTGTVTLIAVPLISTGVAWLGTLIDADTSFVVSLLAGLGSVFLNQFYRQLTSSD